MGKHYQTGVGSFQMGLVQEWEVHLTRTLQKHLDSLVLRGSKKLGKTVEFGFHSANCLLAT